MNNAISYRQSIPKQIIHRVVSIVAIIVTTSFSQSNDTNQFYARLDELLSAAKNNPRLAAADARVAASQASVRAVKSLDPPQIAFEFYQTPVASFPNPFKDQMEYDYSIQQMIPFPGKLGAMANAEQKQVDMLTSDRQTLEQDLFLKIKSTYYELYLLDRRLDINHQTRQLVRGFIDIARKQYELGMGRQADVLRAQTELSSLSSDSIILVQERQSMQGMLNALCNRPILATIDALTEIKPHHTAYDLNALLTIAKQHRPELASMATGIEMQQAQRSAAAQEFLPDFMVRGMYKDMTMSDDYWSLMAGVTVPIAPWSFGKFAAGTSRADATISEAQAELANMKNMIAVQVNDALLKTRSAHDRLTLSTKIAIPGAEKALESAIAAYQTGKEEFLMVLDIQKMVIMAKLDYHMAVMTLLTSQAELERAVGLNRNEIDNALQKGIQ